jgi:signal transduction histidine kinase
LGGHAVRAPATTRLAWSMFAATAVLATAHGVLVVSGSIGLVDPEAGLNSFPIITLGSVLGALIGALIATRQPRNPIGWLFLVGQLGTGVGLVSQEYAFRVLQDGALGPPLAGQLATVVAGSLGASWALSVLAAVFLLFPDGSLPSHRWRAVLWTLPVPQIAVILSTVLVVPIDSVTRADELSPLVSTVAVVSAAVSVVLLLLSLVALMQRLRRSRGEQRQQLRWLAAAAFALVAGFIFANLVGLGGGDEPAWGAVPLFVAYACLPVAAGVAILRYRLYDIDLVINRAVVGAAVVIFVTFGYVTSVVLLGALLGGRVSEDYWASAVATALVALAFQPLRRGVQRLGDRAIYGRRAVPYQALADLCRRLARAVSLEQVLPGIAEVSGRSIGAAHASVRLAVAGAEDVVAHWPTPPSPGGPAKIVHTQPVGEGPGRLGEITVSMPPGRQVSATDRTLLADIATQAGLGMRNAQLAAQLRVQVEQAGAQTEELEASRLRLLAAQESQRQRLTRAVSAEVLPHLGQLRVGLTQAAAATEPAVANGLLDTAMETTNRALEALRDIARGVFPPLLARKGLAAALRQYSARASGHVALNVSTRARTARFPSTLEAVTYFCAVETVRELGGSAQVDLDLDDSQLTLTVTAVDHSGRLADGGQGVVDRVLAWGGTVTIDAQSAPARLRVSFPQPPVMAQTALNLSGPNADLAT